MRDNFDFLTLSVSLWRDLPSKLEPIDLYNDTLWSLRNDRIDFLTRRAVLHETLHYWQLLCFRFLQDLVTEEWIRVLTYQVKGELLPPSQSALEHRSPNTCGFSTFDLLESLTRFWELQDHKPIDLIEQEAIEIGDQALLDSLDPQRATLRHYPWLAIELAMSRGMRCVRYGSPYRWMVQRFRAAFEIESEPYSVPVTDELVAVPPHLTNPGFAAAMLFPAIAYFSLSSPKPADAFVKLVDAMCADSWVVRNYSLMIQGMQDITVGPIYLFDEIAGFAIENCPDSVVSLPEHWSNIDEIGSPPFIWTSSGHRNFETALDTVQSQFEDDDLAKVIRLNFEKWGLFGMMCFMGERDVRRALSGVFPIPRIRIRDGTSSGIGSPYWNDEEKDLNMQRLGLLNRIAENVRRFRNAEKAVELGLPMDAFD